MSSSSSFAFDSVVRPGDLVMYTASRVEEQLSLVKEEDLRLAALDIENCAAGLKGKVKDSCSEPWSLDCTAVLHGAIVVSVLSAFQSSFRDVSLSQA